MHYVARLVIEKATPAVPAPPNSTRSMASKDREVVEVFTTVVRSENLNDLTDKLGNVMKAGV